MGDEMSELATVMRMTGGKLPTAIQQINYPVHQGKPNPAHGKFYFVGNIPAACYDPTRNGGRGGSKLYDTEQDAIDAAIESGATHIQGADCRIIKWG